MSNDRCQFAFQEDPEGCQDKFYFCRVYEAFVDIS